MRCRWVVGIKRRLSVRDPVLISHTRWLLAAQTASVLKIRVFVLIVVVVASGLRFAVVFNGRLNGVIRLDTFAKARLFEANELGNVGEEHVWVFGESIFDELVVAVDDGLACAKHLGRRVIETQKVLPLANVMHFLDNPRVICAAPRSNRLAQSYDDGFAPMAQKTRVLRRCLCAPILLLPSPAVLARFAQRQLRAHEKQYRERDGTTHVVRGKTQGRVQSARVSSASPCGRALVHLKKKASEPNLTRVGWP